MRPKLAGHRQTVFGENGPHAYPGRDQMKVGRRTADAFQEPHANRLHGLVHGAAARELNDSPRRSTRSKPRPDALPKRPYQSTSSRATRARAVLTRCTQYWRPGVSRRESTSAARGQAPAEGRGPLRLALPGPGGRAQRAGALAPAEPDAPGAGRRGRPGVA